MSYRVLKVCFMLIMAGSFCGANLFAGSKIHLIPGSIDRKTDKIHVYHFQGTGKVERDVNLVLSWVYKHRRVPENFDFGLNTQKGKVGISLQDAIKLFNVEHYGNLQTKIRVFVIVNWIGENGRILQEKDFQRHYGLFYQFFPLGLKETLARFIVEDLPTLYDRLYQYSDEPVVGMGYKAEELKAGFDIIKKYLDLKDPKTINDFSRIFNWQYGKRAFLWKSSLRRSPDWYSRIVRLRGKRIVLKDVSKVINWVYKNGRVPENSDFGKDTDGKVGIDLDYAKRLFNVVDYGNLQTRIKLVILLEWIGENGRLAKPEDFGRTPTSLFYKDRYLEVRRETLDVDSVYSFKGIQGIPLKLDDIKHSFCVIEFDISELYSRIYDSYSGIGLMSVEYDSLLLSKGLSVIKTSLESGYLDSKIENEYDYGCLSYFLL